jgi:Calx-beta domain
VIVRAQLAFAAATLFLVLAAASAAADAPSLAVSDALLTEGDSGTKNALFTVSLSAASAGPVTVDYATADGSAKAPGDYAATTGTLTFAAGELSKQVAVAVVGDTLDELHETYSLDLSNPVGATLGDARGAGTILDNDPQVSLSVDDVSAPEGGQTATFTLSLSRESGKIVTVDYATGDGTAAAPSDYASRSGTIIFMAGETSKTVSVALVQDAVVEPDETFTLALSRAINTTLSDGQGVATIVDDDAAPPPPPGDEEPPVSEPPADEPPADPPTRRPTAPASSRAAIGSGLPTTSSGWSLSPGRPILTVMRSRTRFVPSLRTSPYSVAPTPSAASVPIRCGYVPSGVARATAAFTGSNTWPGMATATSATAPRRSSSPTTGPIRRRSTRATRSTRSASSAELRTSKTGPAV